MEIKIQLKRRNMLTEYDRSCISHYKFCHFNCISQTEVSISTSGLALHSSTGVTSLLSFVWQKPLRKALKRRCKILAQNQKK